MDSIEASIKNILSAKNLVQLLLKFTKRDIMAQYTVFVFKNTKWYKKSKNLLSLLLFRTR